MSDKPGTSAAENAAGASPNGAAAPTSAGAPNAAPKKPVPEGNPAFRMMGLPRLRLPSRNWMIFLGITGSFGSAVVYDKWQTRRVREKWCNLVSHVAEEHLDTKTLPRKVTIYLAAPPGDGLRGAREHFHNYIKPVLVAAALDWDVVEGRKEGDVRFKTAERIRRKRRRGGEGEPLPPEDYSVDTVREKNGTQEGGEIAGDLILGRHTWKEYIRGLHEGWLGPVVEPAQPEQSLGSETLDSQHLSGQGSLGDAVVKAVADVATDNGHAAFTEDQPATTEGIQSATELLVDDKKDEEKKEEEEKPKSRQPPPYILPSQYNTATISALTPEVLGPSAPMRYPHLLGIRNTPFRIYRFLTRRHLADDIGRQVAAVVLANHRPYGTSVVADENSAATDGGKALPEQVGVLDFEQRDWWKTVYQPRKEHEENVYLEDIIVDERLTNRMRRFELTSEDEDRARRVGEGKEVVKARDKES